MSSEQFHLHLLFFILGISLIYTSRLRPVDITLITKEHNRHRRDVANGVYGMHVTNMNKLTWSSFLQRRAYELLSCSMFENDAENINTYSMNIGLSSNRNYTEIVLQWFREILYFLPEYGTCVNLSQCRKFMTMTNAAHHEIGCAQARCQTGNTALLCLYSGSNSFLPVYKRGSVCTKCEGQLSFCEDGLCVNCDQTANGDCDCRKTCKKPLIGLGLLDNTTCTCQCTYGLGPNCDEECRNPEQYVDWDICSEVNVEDCSSPDPEERELLREFCPEKCTCRRYPRATIVSSIVNQESQGTIN